MEEEEEEIWERESEEGSKDGGGRERGEERVSQFSMVLFFEGQTDG